jgi:hypothetical protein
MLRPLEQRVADLVRSSQNIVSISQAVEELVLNSTYGCFVHRVADLHDFEVVSSCFLIQR